MWLERGHSEDAGLRSHPKAPLVRDPRPSSDGGGSVRFSRVVGPAARSGCPPFSATCFCLPMATCVIKGGEGESASREGGPNRPCPIADVASHPLRHVPLVRSKCHAPLLAGGGRGAVFQGHGRREAGSPGTILGKSGRQAVTGRGKHVVWGLDPLRFLALSLPAGHKAHSSAIPSLSIPPTPSPPQARVWKGAWKHTRGADEVPWGQQHRPH